MYITNECVQDMPDKQDIVYQYEQKLLVDEKMAELRQQVEDKDQELEELKTQLDRTVEEYQQSLQRLTDAENQVNLTDSDISMYFGDSSITKIKKISKHLCGAWWLQLVMASYLPSCSSLVPVSPL